MTKINQNMKCFLFIDIDGVLVTEWSCLQSKIILNEFCDYEPYDPKGVKAINKIIDAINPYFIISSNRRFQSDIETFRKIWSNCGITYKRLGVLEKYGEGMVFASNEEEKTYDINEYIQQHSLNCKDYMIIDDDDLPVDNLVRIHGKYGFGLKDANKIITFFMS